MNCLKNCADIRKKLLAFSETSPFDKTILDDIDKLEALIKEELYIQSDDVKGFKMLFEKAADSILLVSEDGLILTVNSAACKKYKISYFDFIGKSVIEVDTSPQLSDIMSKVDELKLYGSTRFEAVHINSELKTFEVDVIAQKIEWFNEPAYLFVCRDISRQKQLQKALNVSELKLSKIINQMYDGVIVFENDNTVIIWNGGAEDITGVKSVDAVGKKIGEIQQVLQTDSSKEMLNKILMNMRHSDSFKSVYENEIYVEGKGVRMVRSTVFPIHLEQDNYIFGTIVRDITEFKEAENKLLELIATRDKIFSIIAHDLRAPFSSIIGFTDLLLEKYGEYDDEKIYKILQYINLSAKPTLDVLSNMLHWVNMQTGKLTFNPERCSLKKITQEVIQIMNSTAVFKNIILNHQVGDNYIISADTNMIKSVIQNLVSNAIKFSPSGSRVDVSARRFNEHIEVEVSDNGVGIDIERLETLFHVDEHKNRSTRGTVGEQGSGLGLILCKEFVEKHGGRIWAESNTGKGSRFIFTVPYSNPK